MNTRIGIAVFMLCTLFGESDVVVQQRIYGVLQDSIKKRSFKTFKKHQGDAYHLDFTVIQLLQDLCVAYIDAFDMMLDLSPELQYVVMNKKYLESCVYPTCIVQHDRLQKTIRIVCSLPNIKLKAVESIVREFEVLPHEEVYDRAILEKERVEQMLVILHHAEDYALLDAYR